MGYNTIEFLTRCRIVTVLENFGLSSQSAVMAIDKMLELGYIGEKGTDE